MVESTREGKLHIVKSGYDDMCVALTTFSARNAAETGLRATMWAPQSAGVLSSLRSAGKAV
jgi:hypothetical protein